MSRTVETLKKIPAGEALLHKDIADTYFSQKWRKKNNVLIKNKKVILTFIASLVLLSLTITYFIFIAPALKRADADKIINGNAIKIFDNGRLDKVVVEAMAFNGYAKGNSRISGDTIILNNPKKYNWAEMVLGFRVPVDFSDRDIVITAKGSIGGEKLGLVLKDADNRSLRLNDIYLVPKWRTEKLSVKRIGSDIDLSRITHIRLDYGRVGESSKKSDSLIDFTMYLKSLMVVKEAKP